MSNDIREFTGINNWILDHTDSAKAIDHLIGELLKARKHVAAIWSIHDVSAIRPDLSLSECWEILQHAARKHAHGIGLTRNSIESVAYELYPDVDEHDKS